MALISLHGSGTADSVANLLRSEIPACGVSCELVESASRQAGDATVVLLVFEKYYYRASNRASLSILVTGCNGSVTVDAIGSGGGQGALFRFSWGAEENFVNTVSDILRQHGFC